MSKVYVVNEYDATEGEGCGFPIAVFDNKNEADAYCEYLKMNRDKIEFTAEGFYDVWYAGYNVDEFNLNEKRYI